MIKFAVIYSQLILSCYVSNVFLPGLKQMIPTRNNKRRGHYRPFSNLSIKLKYSQAKGSFFIRISFTLFWIYEYSRI